MTFFTVLHFIKRFFWDCSVFTKFIYYCDLFFFGTSIAYSWSPLSRVSALYWYYKNCGFKVYVTSFSFIQFSYYRELFCSAPASRICNHRRHMWVCYIDTTKITVAYMSSLLLSIDLLQLCYFIMFYFKLTNDAMVKWWMVKCCNDEINNRTGHLFSHKYRICSLVLFSNRTFPQQTKQSIILNIWSLTTSTATKFIS